MKALSYFILAITSLYGLGLVINTAFFYIEIWGVAGGVFSILLFPLAIIFWPIVQFFHYGNIGAFFGYLLIGIFFGLFKLYNWLSDKAEEQKFKSV